MVFSNLLFLYLFIPLNLILYFATKNIIWRNSVLIFFSLVFYAWGEPVWITLLIFSAFLDYVNGLFAEKHRGKPGAKIAVLNSLIINLGILALFKYSGFFIENLNTVFSLNLKVPSYSLPIGISFYTFQTISYVLDVYKGNVKAQKSFPKFLLFVSMYHQLVAGPIVRYTDIVDEIDSRETNIDKIIEGAIRVCVGLGKKVILANTAGYYASAYMDGDLSVIPVAAAWFGIIMFTFQIYFDFSGYSDMAIGLGKIFGFTYPENFNYPYIAKSATEFWRRWHMTLGSFFRDYLYIPLGGNRRRVYFNIFVVWSLTGFWHGASWNFILWGLLYFVLIAIERLFLSKLLKKIPAVFSNIYLLLAVIIGWVLFYFTDLSRAVTYLKVMFFATKNQLIDFTFKVILINNIIFIILAIICCLPIGKNIYTEIKKRTVTPGAQAKLKFIVAGFAIILLFISTAMLVGESYNPFLYYRF